MNWLTTASGEQGTREYVYDPIGNLLREVNNGTTTEYVYNALNQLIKKSTPETEHAYAYDKRGNLREETENGNITSRYSYDATNRMTLGVNAEGEESGYEFNGLGFRVATETKAAEITSRTEYVVDITGGRSFDLMTYESSGRTTRAVYGYAKISETIFEGAAAKPAAQNPTAAVPSVEAPNPETALNKLYYHQDRMGSTSFVSDTQGTALAYVERDEWGKPRGVEVLDDRFTKAYPTANKQLEAIADYTGHMYDATLEVYFAQYRLYDPENKRFNAADPSGYGNVTALSAMNLYVYANGNPLRFLDYTGRTAVAVRAYNEARGNTVIWIPNGSGPNMIAILTPSNARTILTEGIDFYRDSSGTSYYYNAPSVPATPSTGSSTSSTMSNSLPTGAQTTNTSISNSSNNANQVLNTGAWSGDPRCVADALDYNSLLSNLSDKVSDHMSILKKASTIFHNSTKEALDVILGYDVQITEVAEKYGVGKALIQSVLMREIRWAYFQDDYADSLVIATETYYEQMERFLSRPWSVQAIYGPPEIPVMFRDDSSPGLGQVTAKTAISAYNWYNSNTQIDYNDRNRRFGVWNRLRTDNSFNIDAVGVVLLYGAEKLLSIDLQTANTSEIKEILARYNGIGSSAKTYGEEVYEYYKIFKNFNP
jgi:RHS repeat-associated protein